MASAKQILLRAGIVVVAVGLIGSLVIYWVMHTALKTAAEAAAQQPPAGWMDSIRAFARTAPEVRALSLPRSEDGDGAPILLRADTGGSWQAPEHLFEAYDVLSTGLPPTAEVSAVWRTVAADSSLDRFVRAARQRRWEGLEIAISRSDTAVTHDVFALSLPRFADTKLVAYALVIRSRVRLERGDRSGALEDARAAIGLGEQMARREPTFLGNFMGRAWVNIGATELGHYAVVTRDTALARRAAAAVVWAKARLRLVMSLAGQPDSALAIARDTALALAWRGDAMASLIAGPLLAVRGILLGIPRPVLERLESLRRDHDREFARLAELTWATAKWINDLGPWQRFHLALSL